MLRTDEFIEPVLDFEMFSEQLKRVMDDHHRWKWVIFALHSGLQGMMVLALKGSNSFPVLQVQDVEKWLKWYESDQGKPPPRNLKLARFPCLYEKIKSDEMIMFYGSQKFVPDGTQNKSVEQLNALRNKYVHFTPKLWRLELGGLPAIALDCLEIAQFLARESGNILFTQDDLKKRLKAAFTSAHKSLSDLQQKSACREGSSRTLLPGCG